jgi:predicted Zn-dependent peptidase
MRSLLLIALVACGGPKTDTTPRPPTGEPIGTAPAPAPAPSPNRERAIETPALLATPLPDDPVKATIHRLSNGMTVYISPDPQQPSIVAHVAVRAGSRHDPANSTGLAHYLEHMLFKGTTKLGTLDYAKEKPHLERIATLYGELRAPAADRAKILAEIDSETQKSAAFAVPNELDQLYARIGVTGLNAFTANDATVYISEIPKNRVAQWARVEAARYSDPVFRLFWPELEAVYEEKNRSIDNPAWRVEEAFMRAMFPKHGYGYSSGIGEIEHLKKPAYGDMQDFFARYYTPGNMAILLAGDVDASVIPLLEQEFATFKRPAGAAVEPGQMPDLKGRTEVTVDVPSNEGVRLGWPLVTATHPDRYTLQVMDLLLLDGQSGILQRDLLLPQKVASAGSDPTFMREAGWFELWADALAGQSHAEVEKLLFALVGKIQRGEFTDADIATAILHYEIGAQRQLESNNGRLRMMEEAFINGQNWRDMVSRIEKMRSVTKAEVVRVAKQYLGPNFVVVKKLKHESKTPKIEKPPITPVKLDPTRRSEFAKAILDLPVTAIEPVALREGTDYERGKLATGALISVKNPRNGLFTAVHAYDYGRADDKLACLALEVLRVSGAGKRDAEQLTRHLHELGITITTSCSKSQSVIVISGIDKNLDAGMALLREWLAEPVFDDATLKARVAASKTERANSVASPQGINAASQNFARYGNDSEYLVVASNKDLEAATPAKLKTILARYLTLKHRTSYFGPRATADASKAVVLGDGKVATKPPRPIKFRTPGSLFLVEQETAQTHVWLIWPRRAANDNDRAVGALFSEYASPLLYQEVREARGLAYSVFGAFGANQRKIDDASLMAYVGSQGDKAHDALDAVLATLRKPIDDNRLQIAKETIAQGHRVDRIPPRAIANTVYAWDDQGVKADPRAARIERTLKVDKVALEKWTKAALAQPLIVSVTGDRAKLDETKLKKLAPVTVIPKAKLFGY